MALPIPAYIEAASIQDNSIRYIWDDFGDQLEEPLDEDFVARLEALSPRAVLALMCGTAEWLVHRFANLYDDPGPANYVEAAWAMAIDLRYRDLSWNEYQGREWIGPIKKPISEGLLWLEIAMEKLVDEGTHPAIYAIQLSNLVTYVISEPAPYEEWRDQTIERLELLYPRDFEDDPGEVVPKQAVDPGYDFHAEETASLVNEFLRGLDYRGNVFLRTPQSMLAGGDGHEAFQGTPYTFDIEADRSSRHEGD